MRELIKWNWLRQIAVAVLYFCGYVALHRLSYAHWSLPAGLRLLCLMFVPYRYWTALAIGESAGLSINSIECYQAFGPAYAILNLIPPIGLAMPVVHWCKTRLSLVGPGRQVNLSVLLMCTFAMSIVMAASDWFFLYITPVPEGQTAVTFVWAERYFLGYYLGILTVVPLALAAWQAWDYTSVRNSLTRLRDSRLALDSAMLLLPTLALLMWMSRHVPDDFGLTTRIAMFLPVAGLAMRHGWRGAAVGGTAASIAVTLVMPAKFDPTTIQAYVLMSFAISTLLLLGSRIALLNARDEKERSATQLALQAAQQGMFASELRMQHAADTIEQIATSVHDVQGRLLERLRHLLSPSEERNFSRQFIASRHEVFQLANRLSPRILQTKGLPHALRDASIAHAFETASIDFKCELRGQDVSDLQPAVQLALYRLVSEAAAHIYEQATLSRVCLYVRAGMTKHRRWVVARLDGEHASSVQDLMPALMACEQFRKQVGATGLGIGALRDQAYVYGGTVHLRSIANGTRLSFMLHDAEVASASLNRVN